MTGYNIQTLENDLETARQTNDSSSEFKTLIRLIQAYQVETKLPKALAFARKTCEFIKENGTGKEKTVALANLGCVYWEMAQLKKAMIFFEEALALAKESKDQTGQKILLIFLGISFWRKLEWDRAIEKFEQVPGIDIDFSSVSNSGYAGLHFALERGIAILQNRIKIAQGQNDPIKVLHPRFSMIPLLLFTNRKTEIPDQLKEITTLANHLNKMDILNTIPKIQKFC